MMNLMEIMQAAQGGQGVENLARQFGISTEQAQAAVSAVLPAMSMGLRNQADSVDQMSQFLGTLAQGRHGQAFDEQDKDGDGVPDYLQQQGNDVLGMLFGSKDASRAVAGHAAQFAGLPDSMIKAMLPVIASMVMGGLAKSMSNQGFGGLLGQIASSFGGAMGAGMGGATAGQAGQGGLADILGKMMQGGMMGGAMTGSAPQPNAAPNNPLGGMFGDVLNSMLGGGPAAQAQQPRPQSAPSADPMANSLQAGLDALQGMFRTGAQAQQSQMDGLSQIFGQLHGGAARR